MHLDLSVASQANEFEKVTNSPVGYFPRNPVEGSVKSQVLQYRKTPEKSPLVAIHHPNSPPYVPTVLNDVKAVDDRPAVSRQHQRAQNFHERCLAGAVWPQQAKDLAGLDCQIDAI